LVFEQSDRLRICARLLFIAALVYFFYSLLVYGWFVDWQHNAFVLIEKIRMFPPFADMRWITATSECGVDLPDLVSGRAFGCDPYGRGGIGYPPMSIQLARLLGVTGSHTGLIGLSTGMALVVLLLVQLRQMVPIPWQRDLAGAVILIGFPVELALERANVDIVLFLLMASLAAALASKRVYLLPICLGLAFVLVAGKIYPFFGLCAWLALAMLGRSKVEPAKIAVLFGAVLGLASFLPWYIAHAGGVPNPDNPIISHGFFAIPQYDFVRKFAANSPGTIKFAIESAIFFVKLIFFAIPFITSVRCDMATHFRHFLGDRFDVYSTRFFLIFMELTGLTWLACYFLIGSYDYRMIYALPGWIGCVALCFYLQHDVSPVTKLLLIQIVLMPLIFAPGILAFSFTSAYLGLAPKIMAYLSGLVFLPYCAGMLAGLLILIPDCFRRLPVYKAIQRLPIAA
jgi:hypothetical protein